MKPACQFNRGDGIHDEPDSSPSPQPVESNYEDSNESEDEDEDIEFSVSDESDVNDGVEDEARLHSFDELQLPLWGSFSCWTPNKVRKDEAFQ